jgi:ABC-type oligopeptide transport system ATPase subunit
MTGTPYLDIRDLVKEFPSRSGPPLRAVDCVSFTVSSGEILGLVGETGSGKSTTARCIVRLIEPTSGQVLVNSEDVLSASRSRLRELRRQMQIIFQDPHSSLSPRLTAEEIVGEGLIIHRLVKNRRELRDRCVELLELVGLKAEHLAFYPNQFSSGQAQRIGIARALAVGPQLLICDEPVSALDASVRAQILNLFADLRRSLGVTILFIAHDLAAVRHLCDRVAVIHFGKIVEIGPRHEVYDAPKHEYTRELLLATPIPNPVLERARRRRRSQVDHGAKELATFP